MPKWNPKYINNAWMKILISIDADQEYEKYLDFLKKLGWINYKRNTRYGTRACFEHEVVVQNYVTEAAGMRIAVNSVTSQVFDDVNTARRIKKTLEIIPKPSEHTFPDRSASALVDVEFHIEEGTSPSVALSFDERIINWCAQAGMGFSFDQYFSTLPDGMTSQDRLMYPNAEEDYNHSYEYRSRHYIDPIVQKFSMKTASRQGEKGLLVSNIDRSIKDSDTLPQLFFVSPYKNLQLYYLISGSQTDMILSMREFVSALLILSRWHGCNLVLFYSHHLWKVSP